MAKSLLPPFLALSQALGEENRLRALAALQGGELCLCQIIELLGRSPSTVSKHMTILQQAGLVECRREGRWRFYRLAGRGAPGPVRAALRWTFASLEDEPRLAADRKRLQAIRKKDLTEVGRCYSR
ncbi:MAG: ArsR/SmtB family transcription factor [Planctomycetota bacterium]